MNSHEIDFEIKGAEMQFVSIELDPGEAVVSQPGAMMMMDQGIGLETIFGDGSRDDESFLGKMFSAGKRMLSGENLFMTLYGNQSAVKQKVSFASPYPGNILPVDLSEFHGRFICQKESFLCAAKGVSVGIAFNKKLGAGFFGGEGFIMQKLEGDGLAFLHAGGSIVKRELTHGETFKVDTGCLVGFTSEVDFDIEYVGGIKNTFFGGEGLYFAKLQGPGTVFVQSLPFSRLADRIIASIPRNGASRGEGGPLGGIGNMIGGDRSF